MISKNYEENDRKFDENLTFSWYTFELVRVD